MVDIWRVIEGYMEEWHIHLRMADAVFWGFYVLLYSI